MKNLFSWNDNSQGVVVMAQRPQNVDAKFFDELATGYFKVIWQTNPSIKVYSGLAPGVTPILARLAVELNLPAGTIRGLTFNLFPVPEVISQCANQDAFSIISLPALKDKSGRLSQKSLTAMRSILVANGQVALAFGGKTAHQDHLGDKPGLVEEIELWREVRSSATIYLGVDASGMTAQMLSGAIAGSLGGFSAWLSQNLVT